MLCQFSKLMDVRIVNGIHNSLRELGIVNKSKIIVENMIVRVPNYSEQAHSHNFTKANVLYLMYKYIYYVMNASVVMHRAILCVNGTSTCTQLLYMQLMYWICWTST